MKNRVRKAFWTLLIGLVVITVATNAAAQIQVTSANPNNAAQGTVNLNVIVTGNGFKKGAKAQWFVSGTTNPGGVTVNSTAFNSSGQLTANITVSSTAYIGGFDVVVTNTDGRSGKGTELFAVNKNNQSALCATPVVIAPPINACSSSTAQAGCLDGTFGTGGLVQTASTAGGIGDYAYAVVQQSDGKIVAMGEWGTSTQSGVVLERYNPNGTLDTGFGSGGIARTNIPGTPPTIARTGGVIDPGGNLLIGGFNGTNEFVVRFTPSGALDPTFGTGGIYLFSGSGEPFGIALQPDGKILVSTKASLKTQSAGYLVRLTPNGVIDTSFGTNGAAQYVGASFTRLALQPINGLTYILVATSAYSVIRYTPAGAIDTTFGNSGIATNALCGTGGEAWSIAVDPVSGFYVAGYTGSATSPQYVYLAKYTNDGLLDPTFGDAANTGEPPTGATLLNIAPGVDPLALTTSQDSAGNTLILIGIELEPNFYVARYKANGSLDTTWGGVGVVGANFNGTNAASMAVTAQADRKVVAAGFNDPTTGGAVSMALARFWP